MEVRPRYKHTDMGLVPEDWEIVSLGQLAKFTSGVGINIASLHQQSATMSVPVYGGNGIAGFTNIPLQHEPTIVIGRVGQKCGEVYLTNGPTWITDNALYPNLRLRSFSTTYLAFALRWVGLNDAKNRNDLPLITQAILHATRLSVPSNLEEQEAIAGALSDVDAFIESLEQLIAKKRNIKQGTMQELLTGKRRLPGFSGEWNETQLGLIGKCYRGVSYNPSRDLSSSDANSTLRLLRSNNVQGSRIVFSDMQFVDSSRVSEMQILRPYDILICMANGSRDLVGKSAQFAAGYGFEYTFGAFMGCFRPEGHLVDPKFVFYLFLAEAYRRQIAVLLAGSSINNLTPSSIETLLVSMPCDRNEQEAIAAILADVDSEINMLEAKLVKARLIKQGMMQELLTGRIRLV